MSGEGKDIHQVTWERVVAVKTPRESLRDYKLFIHAFIHSFTNLH